MIASQILCGEMLGLEGWEVPGQRVVIDCAFTRYCHGVNEETSFILKTAGTVRLAQNITAYRAD
ncbi:MAG TPA: hypothetical protein VG122_04720 [Gemmata sp.]|nr:hypothetical protein [Gemmata sp.]